MENVIIKKGVFPAWAGVILLKIIDKAFPCGVPRVGGGDPCIFIFPDPVIRCSPRGRG